MIKSFSVFFVILILGSELLNLYNQIECIKMKRQNIQISWQTFKRDSKLTVHN